MEEKMKQVGRKMSIYMGVTLSFCLSLVGNLSSGRFTIPGFLLSFIISTIISLLIGFFVPMKKVSDNATKNMKPGIGKQCMEAFISDLIYTPVITLCMVFMAWRNATSHGAEIPFLPMFLRSLVLSMIVGFVLIYFLMPFYLKMILGKEGRGPEK